MQTQLRHTFARLTGGKSSDIEPEEATNGLIHVVSLTLTKTADALIDPKLVLSWLLNALGAPGALIGALVPVREAGALLPQLLLARSVEASPQRKLFWAAAAAVQGMAAIGIALAAVTLQGLAAGVSIVILLAILAFARSAASISYKDALARTIAKRRRGTVTGVAGSIASGTAFFVGLLMASGVSAISVLPLAVLISLAGVAFLIASGLFFRLTEPARTNGTDEPLSVVRVFWTLECLT